MTFSYRTQEDMEKLEIYAFANAGHWMKQREGVPHIEDICNDFDNVRVWVRRVGHCKRLQETVLPQLHPTTRVLALKGAM